MRGIWVFLQETIDSTYIFSHGRRTFDPTSGSIRRLSELFVLLTYIIAYHCCTYVGLLKLDFCTDKDLNLWMLHNYLHFCSQHTHSFIFISCMLTRKHTLFIPSSKRERFADTDHRRIMEKGKNIDRVDMVLGLFLDRMTTNFLNQVVINEQAEDSFKKGKKHKVDACILPFPPQERYLLPHQRHVQSNQKWKQKQIS